MNQKIGVLIIHGMGSQRPGFSANLIEELSDRLGQHENRFEWQEVYWANALKQREDQLWDCMVKATDPDGVSLDLDWTPLRKFVLHNFGDAAAYHREFEMDDSAYALVHRIISTSVEALDAKLADTRAPVVVVGHSLGCHMMSNYIWDRHLGKTDDTLAPLLNLVAMVTFGCNIPLFSLSFTEAKPIVVPGKGIKKPSLKAVSKWLNFFDKDDVLGWPLKPLYEKDLKKLKKAQKDTVARIEDYEINVGGGLASWNPGAHAKYWTDNDLTRPVARYLKQIAAALDS